MNYFLITIQLLVGGLLTAIILLQSKGGGLGSTFGGSAAYARTRRGTEKVFFQATIVLSVLFVVISITSVLLS